MKALIYGGGAVGLGIASCLILSGAKVDIIAREGTVSALRKGGLARTGIFGSVEVGPEGFGAFASLDELLRLGGRRLQDGGLNRDRDFGCDYDYVLICTKSHGSPAAAADLSRHRKILGDGGKIVLFQNGWGNAEIFAEHFPKDQIYSARVITGFSRPENNVVEVTVHADSIHLGSLFGSDLAPMAPLGEAIATGRDSLRGRPGSGKVPLAKIAPEHHAEPPGSDLGRRAQSTSGSL